MSILVGNTYARNTTDTGLPVSGVTIFMLSWQCYSALGPCRGTLPGSGWTIQLNLSGLPAVTVIKRLEDLVATIPLNVSFLVCSPNVVIETREIRHDGHGRLTVMEHSYTPKQGNLDPGQTAVMFFNALQELGTYAGPQSVYESFGSESQANLLFGFRNAPEVGSNLTLSPLPAADVTENYALLLQSATKAFLDGTLSTAYVPARIPVERLIFVTSLPQVIASTILFGLLLGISIFSHFRRTTPQFTLFSIAAALDGSEIPSIFAKAKRCADPKSREEDMVAPIGRQMVVLEKSELESNVLHLQ